MFSLLGSRVDPIFLHPEVFLTNGLDREEARRQRKQASLEAVYARRSRISAQLSKAGAIFQR
jgi:hypothetical protein